LGDGNLEFYGASLAKILLGDRIEDSAVDDTGVGKEVEPDQVLEFGGELLELVESPRS